MPSPASSKSPAGSAGGDLTGTYPNPTVAAGGVAIADLSGYPNDAAKYARGDNTFSVIAATQSTTGAGLPAAPGSGAPGRVKAGATPFDFLTMYYDATLGLYLSAPFPLAWVTAAQPTSTSAVYSSLTAAEQAQIFWPYKAFVDAGLSLQTRTVGVVRNSAGGNTTYLAYILQGYSVGAGLVNITADGAGEATTTSGTDITVQSNWAAPTLASSQDYAKCIIRVKVSAGTGTYTAVTIWGRWVIAA